ncbi:MAG: cupin domain-containing protein [Candidatus Omnitrophica bacterium]|nr:cupin domain-containing protein [Candidatus Omnitrophota bacterium]
MLKEKVFCKQLKGRQRFLRLIGDSKKLKGLRSGYVILKPKESVGEHNTGSCEEVISVINGSGLVAYGKKSSIKIKKGLFIYIPPAMPHNVINTGKVPLKYIYTAARV